MTTWHTIQLTHMTVSLLMKALVSESLSRFHTNTRVIEATMGWEPREECLAVTIWFENPEVCFSGQIYPLDEAQAVSVLDGEREYGTYDDILRHVAQESVAFSQKYVKQDTA